MFWFIFKIFYNIPEIKVMGFQNYVLFKFG